MSCLKVINLRKDQVEFLTLQLNVYLASIPGSNKYTFMAGEILKKLEGRKPKQVTTPTIGD